MKRLFCPAVFFLLYFYPAAAFSENLITYGSQEHNYTVEVPSDWEITTEKGQDISIRNQSAECLFSAQVVENTEGMGFEEFFGNLVSLEKNDRNHNKFSSYFSDDFYGKGLSCGTMVWLQENDGVKAVTVLVSGDGRKDIYVLKFYSALGKYDENKPVFERIIKSLSVGPIGTATPMPQPKVKDKSAVTLENIFKAKGFGYSVRYPADWVYTRPRTFTVVFGSEEGKGPFYSTVSIQNLASKKIKGKYEDLECVLKDAKKQIKRGAKSVLIYDEKPFAYDKNNLKLSGREFKAEYMRGKDKFKEWVIIVERSGGEAFHEWAYTSPLDFYDSNLDKAEAMLDSWVISDVKITDKKTK